jgi:hypothetical protein
MIIRYLQGTKDKGLIFKPSGELVVDMYVDSDFLGRKVKTTKIHSASSPAPAMSWNSQVARYRGQASYSQRLPFLQWKQNIFRCRKQCVS